MRRGSILCVAAEGQRHACLLSLTLPLPLSWLISKKKQGIGLECVVFAVGVFVHELHVAYVCTSVGPFCTRMCESLSFQTHQFTKSHTSSSQSNRVCNSE